MDHLTNVEIKNMLFYVADKVIEEKPYLTEVDSAIGDGDHGIGMEIGCLKIKEKLAALSDDASVNALFDSAGKAMMLSMGGASGVIFGSMFSGAVKGMADMSAVDTKTFADMFEQSLLAVKKRGQANLGDKTMVDALEPAVIAMKENSGDGFVPMLKKAEESAYQGVENTKQYTAKFGRAKSLLERSIGHQDAGATSVYIIFRSMREYLEK